MKSNKAKQTNKPQPNTGKKRMAKRIRVGDVINNFAVIEDLGINQPISNEHYYMCRCLDCGREMRMNRRSLRKPNVQCKLCQMEKRHKGKVVDGYVIEEMTNKRNNSRNIIWICRCQRCGRKKEFPTNYITSGQMPKCDCHYFKGPIKSFFDQLFYE